VAEEGCEHEVELGVVADFIDAGIAETYGFSFAIRSEGDFSGERQSDADAGAAYSLTEAGVGLELNYDAVFDKLEFWVLGIDVASGLGVAFEIVAAVGSVKKLLLEGPFESVAADLEFDRTGLS
jgi:hypothetical protein